MCQIFQKRLFDHEIEFFSSKKSVATRINLSLIRFKFMLWTLSQSLLKACNNRTKVTIERICKKNCKFQPKTFWFYSFRLLICCVWCRLVDYLSSSERSYRAAQINCFFVFFSAFFFRRKEQLLFYSQAEEAWEWSIGLGYKKGKIWN